MEITLDTASVEGSIRELHTLHNQAGESAAAAHQSTLNGSFSGVSGLDQLGSGHGAVILGGPGSAGDVLSSYAEQVQWLGEALTASYRALTGQNSYVGRGMDIADEGGALGTEGISFPQRPRPRFGNFSFAPPVVLPAMSIDQLAREFATTRIGAATAAAATWKQLATSIAQVAAGLHAVAARLVAENSGEVITAAAEKIRAVAAAGDTFAVNAAVMSTSVQQLAAIKSQGAVQVNLARSALAVIVEPVERMAAERAFLAAFPTSFSPAVITGVPPIRNLMSLAGDTGGGGEIALGMADIVGSGAARTGGLAPAGSGTGSPVGGGGDTGGSQFHGVDRGLTQLSQVGHNTTELDTFSRVDALGTASAGLGSPFTTTPTALSGLSGTWSTPAAPTSGLPGITTALGMASPGVPGSGGGFSAPGVTGGGPGARGSGIPRGGIGGSALPAPLPRGGAQMSTPPALPSPAFPGGQPGPGRLPGVLPATGVTTGGNLPLPATSGGVGGGGGGVPGVPVGGMGAPLPGGGAAHRSGSPVVPGAAGTPQLKGGGAGVTGTGGGLNGPGGGRAAAPGGVPTGMGPGEPPAARGPAGTGVGGGVPGATGATGGTAPSGKGTGGVPGRGMMPMMGAPAGGAQAGPGRAGKVRTVTSAVEEAGNIAALLGERSPVVPGVIGDWVRT